MNPFITIKELKAKLSRKECSVEEIKKFYLTRIKKYDPALNSIIESFNDTNVDTTAQTNGLLTGIPYVCKDNILQKGYTASAGSNILKNFKATYDATVIKRLKQHGAFSLGRANQDEFGMGSSGEFSAYGPTRNAWDTERSPGGSGSGSGAAVAAGLAPFSLSTETGGSNRHPAAWGGLVGLYPTYGLNSRFGLMAFASSNDQVGPITKTVYDNALVLSALAGKDEHDATSLQLSSQDYTKDLDGKLPPGLRIGIIRDLAEHESVDKEVAQAFSATVAQLEKLGAKIVYIDIPMIKYAMSVYFIISRAEAASNLSRYDGSIYGSRVKDAENLYDMYLKTRQEGFGIEVKRRILVGNYVLSAGHKDAYYIKAQQVRNAIRAEFQAAFNKIDLLISPTTPQLPWKIGELINDPIALHLADSFLVPNCMIGTPALSLPCGYSKNNLPISFQFLGPRLSEKLIYKVAYAYEQSTDHHLRNPQGYE